MFNDRVPLDVDQLGWPATSDVGVSLRPLRVEDADAYIELVNNNVEHLRPWVQPPSDQTAFSTFIRRASNADFLAMAVCLDHKIVGNINFSQIVYGNFCSAYTGFWIARDFSGCGLMSEALRMSLSVAFSQLGLHRLEANIQPANVLSKKLVQRVGFRLEGYSAGYLFVNNQWADHERWAICAEDVVANRSNV